ncbi:MAG: hypothetical protein C0501_16930 [Isosphaera sp.]|nr:hypothetical protein [Isosphaera sp.]
MTAGLLALALAAPPPPAGLQKGDEFTFSGTVAEAVDRPTDRFRRAHALELRVLVLDRQENWADAVVLTRLKRADDAVAGAVGAVTGAGPAKADPPAVRLDLVRVHADGTAHLLDPTRGLPPVPLDTFPASEFGVFPPRPPRTAPDDPWAVGGAAGRPSETWQAKGTEFVNAERCRVLVMNQQSADWAKPVGGEVSWHRADAVWVSTQDGTARRVHRVIRRRLGREEVPSAWVEVKYELTDQGRLAGRAFDRARRDADVALAALADADAFAANPARLGARALAARIDRLDAQLAEADPAGPYREVMAAARRALDAARRSEAAPVPVAPPAPPPVVRTGWPEPGQPAPDFAAGTFRLAEQKGKPVVLVFFRPGGETADPALAIAAAVDKRYAGRVAVVPLVVFGDVAAGEKHRDGLKLTLPVLDGKAGGAAFGVETAPRFALVDGAGVVRWTFAGVGGETGYLLKEAVDRLVAPASPAGAGGTTPAPGTPTPPATRPR